MIIVTNISDSYHGFNWPLLEFF